VRWNGPAARVGRREWLALGAVGASRTSITSSSLAPPTGGNSVTAHSNHSPPLDVCVVLLDAIAQSPPTVPSAPSPMTTANPERRALVRAVIAMLARCRANRVLLCCLACERVVAWSVGDVSQSRLFNCETHS
jgi:hypothetical protein